MAGRTIRVVRFCLFLGIPAVLLFVRCHPAKVIESSWLKNPINVDGNSSDWAGLINHDPNEPFGIGVVNDDRYLYVCLVSDDQSIHRQVIRYGLTVWLEGGTSEKNRLGICYPLGLAGSGVDVHSLREAKGDSELLRQKIDEAFDAIEVIGPGKKQDTLPMKLTVAESSFDLKLKAVPSMERFTYELRIPLHADSTAPYAVPRPEKSLITLVLESDAPPSAGGSEEQGEHEGGGGMGGGGMGGGGMGGGGMGGGGMGGGGHGGGGHGGGGHHGGMSGGGGGGHHEQPPEPFTVEFSVKLAGK